MKEFGVAEPGLKDMERASGLTVQALAPSPRGE